MSLSLLWFVIAASRLIVVVCRLFQLKSLVSRASALEHPGLRALFQNLLAQQNVRRPVQLRITSEQRSAVFVGLPRPAILVPQETVNDLAEAGGWLSSARLRATIKCCNGAAAAVIMR
jgi:beta-lactamase regulating signal transducer with metallopeptidase domain